MKKIFFWMFCVTLLLLSAAFCAAAEKKATVIHDTPEGCIRELIESLKANDYNRMIALSMADEPAMKFNFEMYAKRLHSLVPSSPAPAQYPLYEAINRAEMRAQYLRQIRFICYGLLTGSDEYTQTVIDSNGEKSEAFSGMVDPSKLSVLELVEIRKNGLVESERYKKNSFIQAKCFGSTDATDRTVIVRVDAKKYVIGVHLLQFGSNWKIDTFVSYIDNTPALGVVPIPDLAPDLNEK
jgi:hypothetical protein